MICAARQDREPEGAAALQRLDQQARGPVQAGQPGEIAQPHPGPGLVAGGPALDAGDGQLRGVLLHGEQLGPGQADRRAGRRPSARLTVSRQFAPVSAGLDARLGRGLVDLEVVGPAAEVLPVRGEQRGAAQRAADRLARRQGQQQQ